MGEIVASRSFQTLEYLADNHDFVHELFKDDVNELVLVLRKIEKLLNNDSNSRKVLENMEKITSLAFSIENALEFWAFQIENAFLVDKNEKKIGIIRFLRRFFGRDYHDKVINLVIAMMFIHGVLQEEPLMKWFHDTFPEDALEETEQKVVIQRRIANHRSLRWPKQMYARGMEEHIVERKEELNHLISLVAEDKEHQVVSVWGEKGLGKTTLARKVYIHPQVRSRFNGFAWVSLSQDDQIANHLQSILNQLVGGAVKKSAEEQIKGDEDCQNLLQSIKRKGGGPVKKSGDEKKQVADEKKAGAEEKSRGAEEQKKGSKEKKESAHEVQKGAEEEKEGVEEKNEIEEEKKNGAGEERKKDAEEQNKGDAEKKKSAEEKKEGADKEEEKKKGVEEQKQGVEEKEKGAEEERKKDAEEQNKGAAEKKKSAEEKKEGAEKEEEKKKGVEEQKQGVEEKKKGAEEERKKDAEEQNKGAAEKKKSAEEKKEGTDREEEKKKGAEEQKQGVEEKKECGDDRKRIAKDMSIGNLLQNMMKRGTGVVRKSAQEKKEVTEEHKKGVDEMKEGAEAKKDGEEKIQGTEEQRTSSEKKMIDQLKETLRQKSCLIVIDDISELSQWNDISSALLLKDTDTKFLLTTDDEATANVGETHKLRLLTEDEGWDLLQKYVFRGSKPPKVGLVPKLGKEMVRKCGKIPSKISSLGRSLSAVPLSEWHKVVDDVTRYLQTDNQSESIETPNEVVDPSYGHLPYRQKQCFLYLAIFKKDEDVDPEDLSFLWMGEGMVSSQHQEKDKEGKDTAQNYLRELARGDLLRVQVDELSANRRFMPLCLRNHAWELSLYLGEKEKFRLKVVDFSCGKQPRYDPYTLSDGTRRMVIHFDKQSSPPVDRNLKATSDLRSLLFMNSDRECVDLPVMVSDYKEFTQLRILHFVRCKFEGRKLPQGICQLLYLRYFGLLYCDLDELPPSISNFRNLHVLNVRSYDDAKIRIPNVISQMIRLKHLRLPHNSDREHQTDKLKLDGLDDLETLVGFNADKHDLESLSKLKKLRYLAAHASSSESLESIINKFKEFGKSDDGVGIRTNLVIEYKCDLTSPEGSTILQEVLMCPNLDALTFSMVLIHDFPNCGRYASSDITQIKLIGCKLIKDPMEALGVFPNLQKLCLGYGAFVGTKMTICDKGFPKLDYLEFRCLPNLEEWSIDMGEMQNLSSLIVKRCPKLMEIPRGLASVSSLKNLEIELKPSALDETQEADYKQMFAFVKSLTMRKLDPSSAGSSSAH